MSSAPPPNLVVVMPAPTPDPSPLHLVKVTSDNLLSSGATVVLAPADGDECADGDGGTAPELMMWSNSLLTSSLICACDMPGRSLAIRSARSTSFALRSRSVSASSCLISVSTLAFFLWRS